MLNWFLYDDSPSNGRGESQTAEETKVPQGASGSGGIGRGGAELKPEFDDLDPAVTAAILAQAAYRGYRLRGRLRRLPAREAERAIRGLQSNAHGFRRMALFLLFFGLYLSLVFDAIDVSFQRTVVQGLKNHLDKVKYGPNSDRTHEDVQSLSDLHQWMQAFLLQTYHGTQVEHPCTACIIKPPDDVCNACNFSTHDEFIEDQTDVEVSQDLANDTFESSGTEGLGQTSEAFFLSGGSSSSSSTSMGLSRDCQDCAIARNLCTNSYLDNCITQLRASGYQVDSEESINSTNLNASLFDDIELQPSGGVSHPGGYTVIENVRQCDAYDENVGWTENLLRFNLGFQVAYDGIGYVADRNRIIAGMLVTFNRRKLLSESECESSRGYYDICLADEENTDPIVPDDPNWGRFRPDIELQHDSYDGGFRGGYHVLLDAGGFNIGLNFTYCTLLVMEDIDLIPTDEVSDVAVQLVTYNGNEQSAYGSLRVDFEFNDGGEVESDVLISAYVLRGNVTGPDDSTPWVTVILFTCIFMGMAWHDAKKWCRGRRAKAKAKAKRFRYSWSCFCGFGFHMAIVCNIVFWLLWMFVSIEVYAENELSTSQEDQNALDSLTDEVLFLLDVSLFVSTYQYVFLFTTLAALYRWIFHILTFHKRMSIVTDTLSRASTHLDHFIFVMVLVVLVFTNLTWLLVGSSSKEFSTLGEAWKSIVRVSLGESENFYPQILSARPDVGPVVVVLYQVLAIILLLNVVIAILLEAYRGVRGGMRGEDTIFQSLVAFLGLSWCSLQVRIRWGIAYFQWQVSKKKRAPLARRPSFKIKLQGTTGVYGVDGRPVLMVRKQHGSSRLLDVERHLSYNCPRYITVTEMQALIEATPVPAFVAKRLVRKIVHEWIFCSDEKPSGGPLVALSVSFSNRGRSRLAQSLPMLRPIAQIPPDPP